MGIISDNLARAVADGRVDLTAFVWRGPGGAGAVAGAVARADPRDDAQDGGPGGPPGEAGGGRPEGGGPGDVLGFVARRARP